MKWPWVSRERLDDVRTGAEATVEFWRMRAIEAERLLAHAHADWKSVFDAAMALRPQPPAAPEPALQIDRVPSIVTQAIKDESGGDPRLAAHLRKRANELKAEKKTPEEIVAQLSTWQSTEEETAA